MKKKTLYKAALCLPVIGSLALCLNSCKSNNEVSKADTGIQDIDSNPSADPVVVKPVSETVTVVSIEIKNNELIVTLSDGSTLNLGSINGANGLDGTSGIDGKPGVIVSSVVLDENGNLSIKLSDNTVLDLGNVNGAPGKPGAAGTDGKDGTDGADGKDGATGADGKDGTDGKDGKPGNNGVVFTNAVINEDNELIITLSDGQEIKLGNVKGKDGVDFVKRSFTVKLNDEVSAVESFDVVEGNAVDLPELTKEGYDFLGWYTADDVLVTSKTGIFKNLELTAKFELKEEYLEVTINDITYTAKKDAKISDLFNDAGTEYYVTASFIGMQYELYFANDPVSSLDSNIKYGLYSMDGVNSSDGIMMFYSHVISIRLLQKLGVKGTIEYAGYTIPKAILLNETDNDELDKLLEPQEVYKELGSMFYSAPTINEAVNMIDALLDDYLLKYQSRITKLVADDLYEMIEDDLDTVVESNDDIDCIFKPEFVEFFNNVKNELLEYVSTTDDIAGTIIDTVFDAEMDLVYKYMDAELNDYAIAYYTDKYLVRKDYKIYDSSCLLYIDDFVPSDYSIKLVKDYLYLNNVKYLAGIRNSYLNALESSYDRFVPILKAHYDEVILNATTSLSGIANADELFDDFDDWTEAYLYLTEWYVNYYSAEFEAFLLQNGYSYEELFVKDLENCLKDSSYNMTTVDESEEINYDPLIRNYYSSFRMCRNTDAYNKYGSIRIQAPKGVSTEYIAVSVDNYILCLKYDSESNEYYYNSFLSNNSIGNASQNYDAYVYINDKLYSYSKFIKEFSKEVTLDESVAKTVDKYIEHIELYYVDDVFGYVNYYLVKKDGKYTKKFNCLMKEADSIDYTYTSIDKNGKITVNLDNSYYASDIFPLSISDEDFAKKYDETFFVVKANNKYYLGYYSENLDIWCEITDEDLIEYYTKKYPVGVVKDNVFTTIKESAAIIKKNNKEEILKKKFTSDYSTTSVIKYEINDEIYYFILDDDPETKLYEYKVVDKTTETKTISCVADFTNLTINFKSLKERLTAEYKDSKIIGEAVVEHLYLNVENGYYAEYLSGKEGYVFTRIITELPDYACVVTVDKETKKYTVVKNTEYTKLFDKYDFEFEMDDIGLIYVNVTADIAAVYENKEGVYSLKEIRSTSFIDKFYYSKADIYDDELVVLKSSISSVVPKSFENDNINDIYYFYDDEVCVLYQYKNGTYELVESTLASKYDKKNNSTITVDKDGKITVSHVAYNLTYDKSFTYDKVGEKLIIQLEDKLFAIYLYENDKYCNLQYIEGEYTIDNYNDAVGYINEEGNLVVSKNSYTYDYNFTFEMNNIGRIVANVDDDIYALYYYNSETELYAFKEYLTDYTYNVVSDTLITISNHIATVSAYAYNYTYGITIKMDDYGDVYVVINDSYKALYMYDANNKLYYLYGCVNDSSVYTPVNKTLAEVQNGALVIVKVAYSKAYNKTYSRDNIGDIVVVIDDDYSALYKYSTEKANYYLSDILYKHELDQRYESIAVVENGELVVEDLSYVNFYNHDIAYSTNVGSIVVEINDDYYAKYEFDTDKYKYDSIILASEFTALYMTVVTLNEDNSVATMAASKCAKYIDPFENENIGTIIVADGTYYAEFKYSDGAYHFEEFVEEYDPLYHTICTISKERKFEIVTKSQYYVYLPQKNCDAEVAYVKLPDFDYYAKFVNTEENVVVISTFLSADSYDNLSWDIYEISGDSLVIKTKSVNTQYKDLELTVISENMPQYVAARNADYYMIFKITDKKATFVKASKTTEEYAQSILDLSNKTLESKIIIDEVEDFLKITTFPVHFGDYDLKYNSETELWEVVEKTSDPGVTVSKNSNGVYYVSDISDAFAKDLIDNHTFITENIVCMIFSNYFKFGAKYIVTYSINNKPTFHYSTTYTSDSYSLYNIELTDDGKIDCSLIKLGDNDNFIVSISNQEIILELDIPDNSYIMVEWKDYYSYKCLYKNNTINYYGSYSYSGNKHYDEYNTFDATMVLDEDGKAIITVTNRSKAIIDETYVVNGTLDSVVHVDLNSTDSNIFVQKIVITEKTKIKYYSSAQFDTYGVILKGDKVIAYDDDSAGNSNFLMEVELEAGTYYFVASPYTRYNTKEMDVHIEVVTE